MVVTLERASMYLALLTGCYVCVQMRDSLVHTVMHALYTKYFRCLVPVTLCVDIDKKELNALS